MKRVYSFLIALMFFCPVLLLVYCSFLPNQTANDFLTKGIFSSSFSFSQYQSILEEGGFLRSLTNSVKIAFPILIFSMPILFFSALMFAFARFKGRKTLFFLYIFALLTPFQIIMMPIYKISIFLGVYDTHFGIIALCVFSPLGTLIMTKRMENMDMQCTEAALLETSSLYQILAKVIVPQVLPMLFVLAFLIFTEAWGMLEQPQILLSNFKLWPMAMSIKPKGEDGFSRGVLYALPVLVLTVISYVKVKRISNNVRKKLAGLVK